MKPLPDDGLFGWVIEMEPAPVPGPAVPVVRKGRVAHRELHRIALEFDGDSYRWFPRDRVFFSPGDARRQARRLLQARRLTDTDRLRD